MQLKCDCTGTVFHIYSDEGGITARCANPECGRWAYDGNQMVFVDQVQDAAGETL